MQLIKIMLKKYNFCELKLNYYLLQNICLNLGKYCSWLMILNSLLVNIATGEELITTAYLLDNVTFIKQSQASLFVVNRTVKSTSFRQNYKFVGLNWSLAQKKNSNINIFLSSKAIGIKFTLFKW